MLQTESFSIITSKKREIVDIGLKINSLIEIQAIDKGLCIIFLKHTTASLTTGYIDPKWDLEKIEDFEFTNTPISTSGITTEDVIPESHKHIIRHIPDHVIASFIGTSIEIPIKNKRLDLGENQAVILIEFNGPKTRNLSVQFLI